MKRQIALLAAAATATTLAVTGCGVVTSSFTEEQPIPQKITTVKVLNDSGKVRISTGDSGHLRREVHYNSAKPSVRHRVENGDTLVIEGCDTNNCWIDYTIVLPEGFEVTGKVESGDVEVVAAKSVTLQVDSGQIAVRRVPGQVNLSVESGDVEVSDAGDDVSVESQSGHVTLRDVSGSTSVRAESGEIEVHGARAPVDVEATSGKVTVRMDEAVDVRAHAQSGDVEVFAPAGKYQVKATVESGDLQNGLTSDPSAQVLIDVAAQSGDVTITAV